jgi:hypothetical protein
MPAWVDVAQRFVGGLGITIPGLRVIRVGNDAVRLQEARQSRVIPARFMIPCTSLGYSLVYRTGNAAVDGVSFPPALHRKSNLMLDENIADVKSIFPYEI